MRQKKLAATNHLTKTPFHFLFSTFEIKAQKIFKNIMNSQEH